MLYMLKVLRCLWGGSGASWGNVGDGDKWCLDVLLVDVRFKFEYRGVILGGEGFQSMDFPEEGVGG
jgi:hypothetical protein